MLANLISNPNPAQESSNNASSLIDMNLLSKAVDKILKFDTQKQSFNRTYPQTDHFQKFYHNAALDRFVDIITKKYSNSKEPISIVDLCCGYGLPTLALRQRLANSGIKVDRIVGYDVSEDMVHFANLNNTFQPQVQFQKKNIETEYKSVEEFDVAICLFGLHWMNDFEPTLQAISRSLKPGGIFLTLTPLGIADLFDARTNFINYSKWSSVFDKSAQTIHPFPNNLSDYTKPLSKYFKLIHSEQKLIQIKFSREEFISYLQSWLQELRHITNDVTHEAKKNAIARAYLSDFVDSIEKKSKEGNVTINEDGSVVLRHRTVDIDGEKIE